MRRILFLALLFCLTLPSLAQDDYPTSYEIALQRIEEARATGTIVLTLANLGLLEIPPEIGNLSNLEYLDLSFNQLTILPAEIGNLSNLVSLFLIDNQLTTLPAEIGSLRDLQELALMGNQLATLPPESEI
jgi:Leucine-rich repeat (LRR) protein